MKKLQKYNTSDGKESCSHKPNLRLNDGLCEYLNCFLLKTAYDYCFGEGMFKIYYTGI